MSLERTSSSYSYEVSIDHFNAIEARDDIGSKLDWNWYGLMTLLEKALGFHNIEYNGHFGSAIYFTVYEDDLQLTSIVGQVINDYAEGVDLASIFEYINRYNKLEGERMYFCNAIAQKEIDANEAQDNENDE